MMTVESKGNASGACVLKSDEERVHRIEHERDRARREKESAEADLEIARDDFRRRSAGRSAHARDCEERVRVASERLAELRASGDKYNSALAEEVRLKNAEAELAQANAAMPARDDLLADAEQRVSAATSLVASLDLQLGRIRAEAADPKRAGLARELEESTAEVEQATSTSASVLADGVERAAEAIVSTYTELRAAHEKAAAAHAQANDLRRRLGLSPDARPPEWGSVRYQFARALSSALHRRLAAAKLTSDVIDWLIDVVRAG